MIKITLDPGHGATANQSPLNKSFYEGANNFYFAEYLREELLKYDGVEVVMTRNDIADDPSLEERGKMAVNSKSDLFYSIHSNAFFDPTAYGVTGFYSVKTPDALPLAQSICASVAALIPRSKVRRVITKTLDNGNDYYGVLRASEGVRYSMLVEHGFHTNQNELDCLISDEWKRECAKEEARIIAEFFGLKKREESVLDEAKPEENTIGKELDTVLASLAKLTEEVTRLRDKYSV